MDTRFIHERVENDEEWTLMSEHECPGLSMCMVTSLKNFTLSMKMK